MKRRVLMWMVYHIEWKFPANYYVLSWWILRKTCQVVKRVTTVTNLRKTCTFDLLYCVGKCIVLKMASPNILQLCSSVYASKISSKLFLNLNLFVGYHYITTPII